MTDKQEVLKVRFLGGFTITYGDKPISFGKSNTTKSMRLLQLLLFYGAKGIARGLLIETLYGRAEYADASNSLRVAAHRLKKMLIDAGLPSYDYIEIKKGTYYWDAPFQTDLDVERFEKLIEQAETEPDLVKKTQLQREAIHLYQGEFLGGSNGEDWLLLEGVRLKKQYSKILRQVCEWQMDQHMYKETIQICSLACELYPFDEWQAVRIDCYIALKQYKEAMKEYENTAKLFFEELGINPSEKMMQQFEEMSGRMNYKPQELKRIKSDLKEAKEEFGAYYCSFPSFRDNYRLISRLIERNGQSAYLMLCSLTNGKGQPMQKGSKLDLLAKELDDTIRQCLRRGDSYTKYSESQFLTLLTGTDKESCKVIYDRISNYFCREHKSWAQYLEFYVTSIAEVQQCDSKIRFADGNNTW